MGKARNLEKAWRPVLVWVVCLFSLLSIIASVLSYVRIVAGGILFTGPQWHYYTTLNLFDYFLAVIVLVANIIAMMSLFLLKKRAFLLYLAILVAGVTITIYQAIFNGWLEMMGYAGVIGWLLGCAVQVAIIIYCRKLIQRNVLK